MVPNLSKTLGHARRRLFVLLFLSLGRSYWLMFKRVVVELGILIIFESTFGRLLLLNKGIIFWKGL